MPTLDFPANPTVGQEHDHGESIWMWDGSKWMAVMEGGSSVVVADSPPPDMPPGTIWFDSSTAQTLVLYGNSWVEIGTVQGDSGPGVIDSSDILVGEDGSLELVNDSVTINGVVATLGQSVTIDTNQVAEGTNNKYYTDPRVRALLANSFANGSYSGGISASYNANTGALTISHVVPSVSVASSMLQDGSVTTPKIADGSITSAKIADGTVIAADIADLGVTTAKLAEDAVTEAKLADNAVVTASILDLSVTTEKLADAAITTDKIANNAVTTSRIATGAITTARLANSSVTQEKLVPPPIHYNANTITSNVAIPVGFNGMSSGPITIADGIVITISDGSSWSIV